MKKRLITLLIPLLLLSLAMVPQTAQAAHTIPLSYSCAGYCWAWTGWDGTQYGGQDRFFTTGASMAFHSSLGTLDRYIAYLSKKQGVETGPRILVGQEVSLANQGICGSFHTSSQAAYYFVQAYDSTNNESFLDCEAMPGGDANTEVITQVNPYVSDGGGMLAQLWGGTGDHFAIYVPYTKGINHSWVSQMFEEAIQDSNVTGHEVWGVYDEEFAYAHSDGTFV